MIIVKRKLTAKMIEATRGYAWSSETEAERVQLMWDAMLDASDCIDLEDNKQQALFKMGKRSGREEIRDGIKELLNITDCICGE